MAKKEPFYKGTNQKQFLNKDGYLKGGVEVKIPEGIPTVNKGAVTINIINNTSITSTNGVTLISLIGSLDERLN